MGHPTGNFGLVGRCGCQCGLLGAAFVLAAAPDGTALARLLGAVPAGPAAPVAVAAPSSRFALLGVLSGRSSGGGAALISLDGKPARPFRVGAQVDSGLVLQSLGPRQASLGASVDGPTTVRLEMPPKG